MADSIDSNELCSHNRYMSIGRSVISEFLALPTGVSTTAGHDDLYEQSYPIVLNGTLGRLMAAAGVRYEAINVAMGNTRVSPYRFETILNMILFFSRKQREATQITMNLGFPCPSSRPNFRHEPHPLCPHPHRSLA